MDFPVKNNYFFKNASLEDRFKIPWSIPGASNPSCPDSTDIKNNLLIIPKPHRAQVVRLRKFQPAQTTKTVCTSMDSLKHFTHDNAFRSNGKEGLPRKASMQKKSKALLMPKRPVPAADEDPCHQNGCLVFLLKSVIVRGGN